METLPDFLLPCPRCLIALAFDALHTANAFAQSRANAFAYHTGDVALLLPNTLAIARAKPAAIRGKASARCGTVAWQHFLLYFGWKNLLNTDLIKGCSD